MSYTVGIKRKFWFGYQKVTVSGHEWQNGRLILNRLDGSQEHIPGYAVPSWRVYSDIWNHIGQIERNRPRVEPRTVQPEAEPAPAYERQGAVAQEPQGAAQPRVIQEDYLMKEARRRAAERIASISGGYGPEEGLAPRPSFS